MSLKSVDESGRTVSSEVLYEGHEIKQEIVLGPVVLQKCDFAQLDGENKDIQANMAPKPNIKQEPVEDELLLVADLGTNEMVRLGLTPETMGADYDLYQKKITTDIKKEATTPTAFATEPRSVVGGTPPSRHVDAVVKEELLKDEASHRENGMYRRSRRINKKKNETKFIKYSSNLTFETESEDNDTDSEYEVKNSKHDVDTDEKHDIHNDKKPDVKVKRKGQKKRHICDFCNKEFNYRTGLTNHIRTHTGEKPYSCNICHKKFADYAVLVRHKRMHAGLKPHACDVCGKKYSEKYLLKNHKLVHTGEMRYSCKFCPKQFVNSSNYKRHQKVHMHRYECDMCGKRYENKESLVPHIVNHMKPKGYECKFCKKGFLQVGHLNRHLAIHVGAREKYSCKNCEQKFTQRASLKRHEERSVCKKK